MKRLIHLLPLLFSLIVVLVLLTLSIKGMFGNPTEDDLNDPFWREHGVFELSPERGRFALTYSIVEQNSVRFTEKIARFAVPDVATYKGTYVSLFAPAVSYIVAPGYLIGKTFNVSQVGTFATIAFFGFLNFWFIYLVATKMGANRFAALVGSFTFLFATPAFAYAVNLYQHHISTFIILVSVYVLLKRNSVLSNAVLFFLCGVSVAVDYPNFFFMLPVGLAALTNAFEIKRRLQKVTVNFYLGKILAGAAVLIPLLLLFAFQADSYGSATRLSGSLATAKFDQEIKLSDPSSIPEDVLNGEKDTKSRDKNVLSFFESRGLLNGFYLHFISPDRGMLFFTPVILIGFIGAIVAYRRQTAGSSLLITILFTVIVTYSLWGDPWGGWAFGSRYFVPVYAILAIFISLLLTYVQRWSLLLIAFVPLFIYSSYVNAIGALTTIAVPPKVEVLALEKLTGQVQPYSYDRGEAMLDDNTTKSFFYKAVVNNRLTAWEYLYLIAGTQIVVVTLWLVCLRLSKENT